MLTLEKALHLHQMISPYLPELKEGIEALTYVMGFCENAAVKPGLVVDTVSLMTGKTAIEILEEMKVDKTKLLEMLVTGFVDNKVIELSKFCEGLGW